MTKEMRETNCIRKNGIRKNGVRKNTELVYIIMLTMVLAASLLLCGCGAKSDNGKSGGKLQGIKDSMENIKDENTNNPGNVEPEVGQEAAPEVVSEVEGDNDENVDSADLTFENLICGTYVCDPDSEDERRVFDILSIDGCLYMEYVGMYEYSAAAMTLLDEEPLIEDGNYYFMVRMYPYSTFAFAGEFQGGSGVVCCIKKNSNGNLEISKGAGIHNRDGYTLNPADAGTYAHPVLSAATPNTQYPGIIGSYRCNSVVDGITYEHYYEFHEDGTLDYVDKAQGYVPSVNRAIYHFEEEDGKINLVIDAEIVGNGDMPNETIYVEYDDSTDSIVGIDWNKTSPRTHGSAVMAGPCERAEEVEEMWAEYMGDSYFSFDFTPEMVDAISKKAAEYAGTDGAYFVSIQESDNGGMAWICCYDQATEETKNYINYEFGTGNYQDVFGGSY